MKLIELLARELREWPAMVEGGESLEQDVDMSIIEGGGCGTVSLQFLSELASDHEFAYVTRAQWETAVAARHTAVTPTLETMLAEWRDLEARAQAAQAEADALFEHAGQCHGEIVVRLAELGWGAPRGKPVVTLDDSDGWIEWKGGKVPVSEGTVVDLKTRDGDTVYESVVGETGNNTWYQFW